MLHTHRPINNFDNIRPLVVFNARQHPGYMGNVVVELQERHSPSSLTSGSRTFFSLIITLPRTSAGNGSNAVTIAQ